MNNDVQEALETLRGVLAQYEAAMTELGWTWITVKPKDALATLEATLKERDDIIELLRETRSIQTNSLIDANKRIAELERQLDAEAGWTANDLARERKLKERIAELEADLEDRKHPVISYRPDEGRVEELEAKVLLAKERLGYIAKHEHGSWAAQQAHHAIKVIDANPAPTTHGRYCKCSPCKAEDWERIADEQHAWAMRERKRHQDAEEEIRRLKSAAQEVEGIAFRQYLDWMHFHELAMIQPFHAESEAQDFARRVSSLLTIALGDDSTIEVIGGN